MSPKLCSSPDAEPEGPKKKRARTNRHHVDLASGQRYALSGSGFEDDDEFDIADCSDAMAYLDSVRQEASTLTQVLAVKKYGPQIPTDPDDREGTTASHGICNSSVGDFRGYFKDGAYIAAPSVDGDGDGGPGDNGRHDAGDDMDSVDEDEAAREAHIREAYYRSILARFASLRAVLHARPPRGAARALPRHNSPHVGPFGVRSGTFIIWSDRLRSTDPHPVQLAAMTKEGVLRVLRVLLWGKHLRRGRDIRERTARWVWALLARLPDRSVLDHVEIGWVRDLGRRAVLLATDMTDLAVLRDEVVREGGDLGVHEDVDGSSEGDEDELAEMEVDGYDESGFGGGTPAEHAAHERGEADERAPVMERTPADAERPGALDGTLAKDDAASVSGKSMDLSDGEIDETTAAEAPMDAAGNETDNHDRDALSGSIEQAKARALRQIQQIHQQRDSPVDADGSEEEEDEPSAAEPTPEQVNTHATLAMILTVAGELYGQRDLLEFRHPFPAIVGGGAAHPVSLS